MKDSSILKFLSGDVVVFWPTKGFVEDWFGKNVGNKKMEYYIVQRSTMETLLKDLINEYVNGDRS